MNVPDGFDPDPTKWLETSFAFEAVLSPKPKPALRSSTNLIVSSGGNDRERRKRKRSS